MGSREQLIGHTRNMRCLFIVLLTASTVQAVAVETPRIIEFINKCEARVQVWRQTSRLTSGGEVAMLESGQSYTGNISLSLHPTSFTNGANGLTQANFRSFVTDRYEMDVRRGFDTRMKIEAGSDDAVLTCSDADCAGESQAIEEIAQVIPYDGNFTVTFCP